MEGEMVKCSPAILVAGTRVDAELPRQHPDEGALGLDRGPGHCTRTPAVKDVAQTPGPSIGGRREGVVE